MNPPAFCSEMKGNVEVVLNVVDLHVGTRAIASGIEVATEGAAVAAVKEGSPPRYSQEACLQQLHAVLPATNTEDVLRKVVDNIHATLHGVTGRGGCRFTVASVRNERKAMSLLFNTPNKGDGIAESFDKLLGSRGKIFYGEGRPTGGDTRRFQEYRSESAMYSVLIVEGEHFTFVDRVGLRVWSLYDTITKRLAVALAKKTEKERKRQESRQKDAARSNPYAKEHVKTGRSAPAISATLSSDASAPITATAPCPDATETPAISATLSRDASAPVTSTAPAPAPAPAAPAAPSSKKARSPGSANKGAKKKSRLSLGSNITPSVLEFPSHTATYKESSDSPVIWKDLSSAQKREIERSAVREYLEQLPKYRGETDTYRGPRSKGDFKVCESEYLRGQEHLKDTDKKRGGFFKCPKGKPLKVGNAIRSYGEKVCLKDDEQPCPDCKDGEDLVSSGEFDDDEKLIYWACVKCANKVVIPIGDSTYIIDGTKDWSVMANHNPEDPCMALTYFSMAPYGIPVALLFAIKEQLDDGKWYEKTWDYKNKRVFVFLDDDVSESKDDINESD